MLERVGHRERHDRRLALESGAVLRRFGAALWVHFDDIEDMALADHPGRRERPPAQRLDLALAGFESELLGELPDRRRNRVFARLDQTGRQLPERAVVGGGNRPQRARGAHRRAQKYVANAVLDVRCRDDDGVERFARRDVVGERRTLRAVREACDQIEALHVEKAARRRGLGRAIASHEDAEGRQRGERPRWHGGI